MRCIKLKFTIILIFTLWSNVAVAACYFSDNEFDGNNIKGMYVEFSEDTASCRDNKAPYVIITPEGSNIQSSENINFTITDFSSNFQQSGDKASLIKLYSKDQLLAEIFIHYDGSKQSIASDPPNIILSEEFVIGKEYTITNDHIQFSSILKIKFADIPKNDKEYQFIGKIDDVKYDESPIIVSRPYRIDYDTEPKEGESYDSRSRTKYAPQLKEGIKSEKTLIYYDYELDYNPNTKSGETEPIECKEGYSRGPDNAGYYFKKDNTREIMFHGCCFKDIYNTGENHPHSSLTLTRSIDFDPQYSYSSDDINQMDLSAATESLPETISNNGVECYSENRQQIRNNMASYYFDIDSCKMKLYGECVGDRTIHPLSIGAADKLNSCSTIQIGDEFQDNNFGPEIINCKNGCIHEDSRDRLSYSIEDGIVTISGNKCIGKTQSINNWLSRPNDLPLGIDGRESIQYVVDKADIADEISCKAGYDGSVQYYFDDGNIIFYNENCIAKSYLLNDSINNNLEGLNLSYIVNYREDGPVMLDDGSACQVGYSPNNLKYYFTTANPNPILRITGSCERNSCSAANINNNNPSNTLNISTPEIEINPNCANNNGNISCAVNTEVSLDCDNGYTPSQDLPKKICQNDGTWSVSGSCIRNENHCGPAPRDLYAYNTRNIGSGSLGLTRTRPCVQGPEEIILTCESDGNWSVDGTCPRLCRRSQLNHPKIVCSRPSRASIDPIARGVYQQGAIVYYGGTQTGGNKRRGCYHLDGNNVWQSTYRDTFQSEDDCRNANQCGRGGGACFRWYDRRNNPTATCGIDGWVYSTDADNCVWQ